MTAKMFYQFVWIVFARNKPATPETYEAYTSVQHSNQCPISPIWFQKRIQTDTSTPGF